MIYFTGTLSALGGLKGDVRCMNVGGFVRTVCTTMCTISV